MQMDREADTRARAHTHKGKDRLAQELRRVPRKIFRRREARLVARGQLFETPL